MRVEWARRATLDLKGISEHIERDRNIETANRVTRIIFDTVQSLAAMPYRGRPGQIENTRELVIPGLPYVVIYRVSKDHVGIARVLHGAQKRV